MAITELQRLLQALLVQQAGAPQGFQQFQQRNRAGAPMVQNPFVRQGPGLTPQNQLTGGTLRPQVIAPSVAPTPSPSFPGQLTQQQVRERNTGLSRRAQAARVLGVPRQESVSPAVQPPQPTNRFAVQNEQVGPLRASQPVTGSPQISPEEQQRLLFEGAFGRPGSSVAPFPEDLQQPAPQSFVQRLGGTLADPGFQNILSQIGQSISPPGSFGQRLGQFTQQNAQNAAFQQFQDQLAGGSQVSPLTASALSPENVGRAQSFQASIDRQKRPIGTVTINGQIYEKHITPDNRISLSPIANQPPREVAPSRFFEVEEEGQRRSRALVDGEIQDFGVIGPVPQKPEKPTNQRLEDVGGGLVRWMGVVNGEWVPLSPPFKEREETPNVFDSMLNQTTGGQPTGQDRPMAEGDIVINDETGEEFVVRDGKLEPVQ